MLHFIKYKLVMQIVKKINVVKLMMIVSALILFSGCAPSDSSPKQNENRKKYSQELGSIMLDIQARHIKLFYAAKNENWELTTFLLQELKESLKGITTYHRSHDNMNLNKLTNQLMIPSIEELEVLNIKEDKNEFLEGYDNLTLSCNNCHIQSKHAFIKIIRPIDGDFLNQDFSK